VFPVAYELISKPTIILSVYNATKRFQNLILESKEGPVRWWNSNLSSSNRSLEQMGDLSCVYVKHKLYLKYISIWKLFASLLNVLDAWGERRCSSYSFMTSALDGVSGQRHAPAALYPGGKYSRYPLYWRLGGPQIRSGHRG
jgi:hypothetical protein